MPSCLYTAPCNVPCWLAPRQSKTFLSKSIMFVDSHCHLNFPELAENLPEILGRMVQNQVTHALVVSVNMPDWPGLMDLVAPHDHLYASVGVHPDYEDTPEPTVDQLCGQIG